MRDKSFLVSFTCSVELDFLFTISNQNEALVSNNSSFPQELWYFREKIQVQTTKFNIFSRSNGLKNYEQKKVTQNSITLYASMHDEQ